MRRRGWRNGRPERQAPAPDLDGAASGPELPALSGEPRKVESEVLIEVASRGGPILFAVLPFRRDCE